ncbi:hypothetical protein FOZ62_021519, partial [Perkinsus olseni]
MGIVRLMASPSSTGLVRAHLMMILAQAFFAGNYVCFKAFSRHSEDIFGKMSATIFSLMRGIVSLVLLAIIFYTSESLGLSVAPRMCPPADPFFASVLMVNTKEYY